MRSLIFLAVISAIMAGCTNQLSRSSVDTPECQIMFEKMGKGSFWLSRQDPTMVKAIIIRCGDSLK